MTPRELRALPEVPCPEGGVSECCANLYYGRRLCSYPPEAHLEILVRVFRKLGAAREQERRDREVLGELDRATRGAPCRDLTSSQNLGGCLCYQGAGDEDDCPVHEFGTGRLKA